MAAVTVAEAATALAERAAAAAETARLAVSGSWLRAVLTAAATRRCRRLRRRG